MSGERILLVEDEARIAQFVERALIYEGYRVSVARDGQTGLSSARDNPPDLVVLDWMLPGLDGLEVCKRLRAAGDVPILMLTAKDELRDRVQGLDAGADDYLVKPFEYPELAARVKALLRRASQAASDVLVLGPLAIDFSAQQVRLDGTQVDLTTFEYRVLEYLVRARPRVVGKQELSDYLYPHDDDRDSNVLEVLVGRLRRKLDRTGGLMPIETLRGRGYRFALT